MSETPVSRRMRSVRPSATMAMNEKALELQHRGVQVLNLTAGEPDQPTPAEICQAAARAMSEGFTKYTPVAGIAELREKLAAALETRIGQAVHPHEIIVTAGGKQGLYNFMMVLLDPGDEVLIPLPSWVSFPEQVTLAEGLPRMVPTRRGDGFFPTVEKLEAMRTERTKALVLNTPNNPTGQVIARETLAALTEWCRERGIFLVFDETYADLTFPGSDHFHPLQVAPEARPWVITVNSFSKTYRMTGWRIGWVQGPEPWIRAMTALQSHSTSNASSISQKAALAALELPVEFIQGTRTLYALRARRFMEALDRIPGVHPLRPQGAFYVWADISAWLHILEMDDSEVALHLLEHAHVAAVPGQAFHAPGFLRFSVAVDEATLERAVQALREYAERFIVPFAETRA